VTLLVEAVAVPAPSFEWRLEGTPLAAQPGSNTLVLNSVATVNVGRYTALACNKLDCRESRPATVRVFTAPKFETQPPSNVSVNLHSQLHLELDVSGIPFPNVQWYFNDQPIEGLQAATLFIPEVALANEGRYHAVLTNNLGTSVGPDTHVDVVEPPTFSLQPTGATVNFLETFIAIVAVDGDAPFSYRWTVRSPGAACTFSCTSGPRSGCVCRLHLFSPNAPQTHPFFHFFIFSTMPSISTAQRRDSQGRELSDPAH
jgi:hypothetical protein